MGIFDSSVRSSTYTPKQSALESQATGQLQRLYGESKTDNTAINDLVQQILSGSGYREPTESQAYQAIQEQGKDAIAKSIDASRRGATLAGASGSSRAAMAEEQGVASIVDYLNNVIGNMTTQQLDQTGPYAGLNALSAAGGNELQSLQNQAALAGMLSNIGQSLRKQTTVTTSPSVFSSIGSVLSPIAAGAISAYNKPTAPTASGGGNYIANTVGGTGTSTVDSGALQSAYNILGGY